MARSSPLATVLFWLMMLLGTAALAPCLLLPAWLERQAQLEYLKSHEAYLAALKLRLQTAQKQIEHLNNDPAYILRLAEQDFGGAFKLPNVETIRIEPGSVGDAATPPLNPPPPDADTPQEDPLLPELSVFIEEAMRRYPHAQVFLDEKTRPMILGMGATLLVAGIVLLGLLDGGRRGGRPQP